MTKQLFTDERNYLKEINDVYANSGTQKKAKEVLLHNIKNIQKILEDRVQTSNKRLAECREEYRAVQLQFVDCMNQEKEHFARLTRFEEACDQNDEMRTKLGL